MRRMGCGTCAPRGAAAVLGLALALIVGAPGEARGQALFGAELLFGSDTDVGLGARVHADLGRSAPNLEVQGAFDVFFPDGPFDYWEINGNLWYRFDPRRGSNVVPYAGGGLNIGHIDREGPDGVDDTDLGLNLGGGVRFLFENTIPFLEARVTVGGVDQLVIGGGVLFGSF